MQGGQEDACQGRHHQPDGSRPTRERFYSPEESYSEAEYDEEAGWTADQLRRMDADVLGFQEVLHEEVLHDVCTRSGRFEDATVVAPRADGSSGLRVDLATRLPLAEPVGSVVDLPAGLDAEVEEPAPPVGTSSRPALRARVALGAAEGTTATVCVVHVESERPIRGVQGPSMTRARPPAGTVPPATHRPGDGPTLPGGQPGASRPRPQPAAHRGGRRPPVIQRSPGGQPAQRGPSRSGRVRPRPARSQIRLR